jgi:hypothetical protein
MKNNLLTLACLLFALAGLAQFGPSRPENDSSHLTYDSSHLDIGWLTLNKSLTQTLTVKGSDLEKMPFVNLSDAIAAWYYGAYSAPARFAYVVDGNPVTDVNIYPIFDIEEVTLIETAVGAAAYGGTQQELVVITTKRGKGRQGLRAAGQLGPVDVNGDGYKTYLRFFHQYFLEAYRNEAKVSYGLSADWIRDVAPEQNNGRDHVQVPFQLQRWRFNGWLEWRPARGHVVQLRASYAPQTMKGVLDSVDSYQQTDHRQLQADAHLIIPQLSWQAALWPGLTNELRAVYMQSVGNYSFTGSDTPPNGGQMTYYGELTAVNNQQVFLSDRLAFRKTAGDWQFSAASNFSYHSIKEQASEGFAGSYLGANSQLIFYPAALGPTQKQTGNLFFVIPGIKLGWRKAFDLQIGERVNASSKLGSDMKRGFPYASVGADLLHFGRKKDGASLKLFGSYAQRSMQFVDDFSLADFSGGGASYALDDVYHSPQLPAFFPIFLPGGSPNQNDTFLVQVTTPRIYWSWEAGISWSTASGRIAAQYNLERRLFTGSGQIGSIGPTTSSSFILLPSWTSIQHHFDFRWKAIDAKDMHWLMGFNLTILQDKEYDLQPPSGSFGYSFYWYEASDPKGDAPRAHLSWTGGFVNRWQFGGFTAGLDILYHFGETAVPFISAVQFNGPRLNSVLVPNVYAGYQWKMGERTFELFAESRGLARSKTSDLLDNRRYYTLGVSLQF